MKRLLTLIAVMAFLHVNTFSQVTSLTVYNELRGSLSSQISAADKKTIENLRVIGQINYTDLKFIGSLMGSYKLHGIIDLEDVIFIGDTEANDNKIGQGYFKGTAKHIKLPKKLVSASHCLDAISIVDTVTIGGEAMPKVVSGCFFSDGLTKNQKIRNLVIREGVKEIDSNFLSSNYPKNSILVSVELPSSLEIIGNAAFRNCHNLININLPDNINSIGPTAFYYVPAFADTVRLPSKLQIFYPQSFYYSLDGVNRPYKNQVVYIPESVTEIYDPADMSMKKGDRVVWHVDNTTPPAFKDVNIVDGNIDKLNAITAYVPKSSVNIYKNHTQWKYTNIIAEPVSVQSVTLDRRSIKMNKGNSDYLQVTVTPSDADDLTVSWYSSNPSVVTVSQYGEINALQSGNAYIYVMAKSNNTVKDSCQISVCQPVTSIRLDQKMFSLKAGDAYLLNAIISPSDADNKTVTWTSADTSIATVDESGNVTALKAGETWIKAISEDNPEACDSCKVTVLQPVAGITLDKSECILSEIGQSEQLEATILPDDANNKNVSWKSSDETVCYVSNGKLVATGYGTCIIIATTEEGGFMATCKVTVQKQEVIVQVEGITITPAECVINGIGQSVQLTAILKPDNATNRNVTWKSLNEHICTVAEDGTVVAVGKGTSVVIATSEDGNFVAYSTITVTEESPIVVGDVNRDGKVDISDIVAIINTIAGNSTYKDTANVNNDTAIDISDIVTVINIIAGM